MGVAFLLFLGHQLFPFASEGADKPHGGRNDDVRLSRLYLLNHPGMHVDEFGELFLCEAFGFPRSPYALTERSERLWRGFSFGVRHAPLWRLLPLTTT